jgi:hypothetical protein
MYLGVSVREFESHDDLWAFPNIMIEAQRILFSKYLPGRLLRNAASGGEISILSETQNEVSQCAANAQRTETRPVGHDKFAGTNVTTEDWKRRQSALLFRSGIANNRRSKALHQSTIRAHRDTAPDRTNGRSFGKQVAIEELTAHWTDFGRFHRRGNTDPTSWASNVRFPVDNRNLLSYGDLCFRLGLCSCDGDTHSLPFGVQS